MKRCSLLSSKPAAAAADEVLVTSDSVLTLPLNCGVLPSGWFVTHGMNSSSAFHCAAFLTRSFDEGKILENFKKVI